MSEVKFDWPRRLGLHVGDWVVVRSQAEILATLDESARLDKLPFQPEMLAFCGKRLRVAKVAHKTCDNIKKTGGRRMLDAVHLEGGRCTGSGHGACMADCVFFWKEAWLKHADTTTDGATLHTDAPSPETVHRAAYAPGHENAEDPVYVCQTTALYEATTLLPWWDVRQYWRDIFSGNHSVVDMLRLIVFAGYRRLVGIGIGYSVLVGAYNTLQRWRGGKPYPLGSGTIPDGKSTPAEVLDLQPGEWVEVKSPAEILPTITHSGFNRGMRYDMEMSKYSGDRFQVQMRVDRLINEQTGKMMQMKSACIQLENVYCRAECTEKRLGCPRASNTYWREIWLRRVDGPRA
jgi:hypothetical protein